MTKVKICGLTRESDVALACALGASYVGLNFAAASPRRVTVARAAELARAAAGETAKVGVFVEEDHDAIRRAIERVPLDLVQLHRPVTQADLDDIAVPIIAAARIEDGPGGLPSSDVLARCHALLWDSSTGSGRRLGLEPGEVRAPFPVPVFFAGGLDADSVGAAIRRFRPDGVDVASGVESAPGVKDPARLERFFAAVREADRSLA